MTMSMNITLTRTRRTLRMRQSDILCTLMVKTLCFFYFVDDFKHQSMKSGVRMTMTRPSSRATRCRMSRSGRTPPGGRSSSWSSPRPTLAASPSPSTRRWSECTGRETFIETYGLGIYSCILSRGTFIRASNFHRDVWAWDLFSYTELWHLYYSVYCICSQDS